MISICVFGSTGFLGSAIVRKLNTFNYNVYEVNRSGSKQPLSFSAHKFDCKNFSAYEFNYLHDCDVVIFASGVSECDNSNFSSDYEIINFKCAVSVLEACIDYDVKRFIYISSIKVCGELTDSSLPFGPDCDGAPDGMYGFSKLNAELAIKKLSYSENIDFVIVRPPLIYGTGVGGNFHSLIKLVTSGIPLPFASVNNSRSLISIENLVNFVLLCTDRSSSLKAANQVFHISDGVDISTSTLLRKVAIAYGARLRLLPVPVSFMRLAAKLIGKSGMADRLFGNLQVDSSKASELLGWKPVVTMDEQLRKMAEFDKSAGKP